MKNLKHFPRHVMLAVISSTDLKELLATVNQGLLMAINTMRRSVYSCQHKKLHTMLFFSPKYINNKVPNYTVNGGSEKVLCLSLFHVCYIQIQ